MTDEDALLAAIAAHPAEDTPRLVYADWLDEHDRPTAAELIRVQCAIAGLDHSSARVRNQNVHLWKRQQDLLEFHRRELLGPLAEVIHERDAVFERGFLTELTLDAEVFLKNAKAVAAIQPLPHVRIKGAVRHLAELIECPESHVIHRLEMQAAGWDLAEKMDLDLIPRFRTAAKSWRLEEMDLDSCRLGDDGIAQLAKPDGSDWRIVELDFSRNEISDVGVRTLAESSLFRNLRRLVLGGNPISDEGARILAAAPGKLEFLNVRFTGIGLAGQRALLDRKGTTVDLF